MIDLTKRRAEFIYEACRIEAIASLRPIVPEPLEKRDDKFRNQFYDTIQRICAEGYVTSPEKEHDSWWKAYEKMGWKYGEKRDPVLKLHPDMVPFNKLHKLEQEKDEIFLALCVFARKYIKEEN